jgi:radical SAM superfamily enzyme YgiQ (UPF0313 family)
LPRLGKPIIAGGPLFTTGHAAFPDIDHFVLGEAEELMPQVVEDMRRGTVQHTYAAPAGPTSRSVPSPRWDLIDLRRLCHDVGAVLAGLPVRLRVLRYHRHERPRSRAPKSPAQLVAELEQLRLRGWQDMVFVVDDNFIGNKKQAKALLREIIQWRTRTGAKMGFLTEASANLADDAELCDLMVRAGFKKVFVGFETPSIESLKECRKAAELRPRPCRDGQDAAAGGPGGHGRVHRGIRQ